MDGRIVEEDNVRAKTSVSASSLAMFVSTLRELEPAKTGDARRKQEMKEMSPGRSVRKLNEGPTVKNA